MNTQTSRGGAATASASESAISIENVSLEVNGHDGGRQTILSNVSLNCRPGEFVALVGKSGCGKTTLLNILSGLTEPTSGYVSVLGKKPVDARRDVGYMFARDALLPWRTAVNAAAIGLELRGVGRSVRRQKATEMLQELGLGDALHKYPWQLSHGMRQRVALARTWVTDPAVVLMDEPFAALDVQTRIAARDQFLAFWERSQKTVVFVTHDLGESLLLADRVVIVAGGEIQREVVVPFVRPRDRDELRASTEFIELENDLSQYIH